MAVACPEGCIAPHDEDSTYHYTAERDVTDVNGKPVSVSSWVNESRGQAGVYVNGSPVPIAAAREYAEFLLKAIAEAEAAAASL